MSDVTTGSAFNPQFFMNPPWWIGRVEEKVTWKDNIKDETFTTKPEIVGWGHRYKVRVFNWHTGDTDKLKPDEISYCQVLMPVTAGSGHGGASITPSIESGSVVFGFFMDGMAGQEGYIIGLLGNSNNNVPKKRAEPASNQPQTSVTPAPAGSPPGTPPTVKTTPPPTPPTGPGSAANVQVPPNVDQLSADQLKKLLDPSKTPSSAVFKAASEARQKAKVAGLPANEVERLVLVATVKASRQSGSDAGVNANCNKGYQQFNDTYTDGSEQTSAKVPDNLIVGTTPLSITEALHIYTKAWIDQDISRKIKIPLLDVTKKNNSDLKGIQRIIKNLINGVEELKKRYNQISAFASGILDFSNQIRTELTGAINEVSGFIKNIIGGVRSYTITKLSDGISQIAPILFPSQTPKLYKEVEKGISNLNCGFNKIVSEIPNLVGGLITNLIDKMINTPLCAIEGLMGGILDSVLGQITGILDLIFTKISLIFDGLGNLAEVIPNQFNSLEYVNGIKQFFKCDDQETPVKYNEVAYGYPALPGGDAVPTPSAANESPTGQGSVASQAPSGNIVNTTSLAFSGINLLAPSRPTDKLREKIQNPEDNNDGTSTLTLF
jgi:hypothetical protein